MNRPNKGVPAVIVIICAVVSLLSPPGLSANASDINPVSSGSLATVDMSWNVDLVSRLTIGQCHAVALRGDTLVLSHDEYLRIVDTSDLASPAWLGVTQLPVPAKGIYLDGRYAYVAAGMSGLRVVDMVDPMNPGEVGFYDTDGFANSVVVAGQYAFVADSNNGLRVIDVSNPATPFEAGFLETPNAKNLAVSGNNVFLADSLIGLYVIDAADPVNPDSIAVYDDDIRALSVAVAYPYVYVGGTGGVSGFHVVDVSDPRNPRGIGISASTNGCNDIVISGNYAFVREHVRYISLVDISNPQSPTEVSELTAGAFVGRIAASGSRVYAGYQSDGTRWKNGVFVIDFANPYVPLEIGGVDIMSELWSVAVSGNYAYLVGQWDGLRVVDISDITRPFEVGSYYISGQGAMDVIVRSEYAYVSYCTRGLRIVDISNPENPVEVGYCDTDECVYNVALADTIAFVADWYGGVRVINILDPSNPFEIGFLSSPYRTRSIDLVGNRAYVADYSGGLKILDISDPPNPVQVGRYSWPETRDAVVSGDYAYVANWNWGLSVVDVSDPAHPFRAAAFDTDGHTRIVDISGYYAYLADWREGLRIVDISDPLNPVEAGYYDTADSALAVTVYGDLAFVSDLTEGLYILRFHDPYSDVVISMFSANTLDRGIELQWEIKSEETIVGINLERSEPGIDQNVLISSLSPQTRRYIDNDVVPGGNYLYTLIVLKSDGSKQSSRPVKVRAYTYSLVLNQNRPNPFNPATTISFVLQEKGVVDLTIYDVEGKRVVTLLNGAVSAGRTECEWDGRNDKGNQVSSGVYFYRLRAGKSILTKKMVLLK